MKKCKAPDCNNPVFSHGYCNWPLHQDMRTDEKWLKKKHSQHPLTEDMSYVKNSSGFKPVIPVKHYTRVTGNLAGDKGSFERDWTKEQMANRPMLKFDIATDEAFEGKAIPVLNYKQVYFTFFGITKADFIPCEVCSTESVDIHHIDNKGMGGSLTKDFIENLAALCRECHDKAHRLPKFNKGIRIIHLRNVIKQLEV